MSSKPSVAVIGSGIVGACVAAELVARGHEVSLIDTGVAGGTQAASFGNGAFLSPASIIPMSFPGMWRKIPSYLIDPAGPLHIRWRYLPRLLPWLWRFVLAGCTQTRFRRTARRLSVLLDDAPARHARLAAQTGQADLVVQRGLIYAFADRKAFEAERLSWSVRQENGVRLQELDGADLRRLTPDLSPRYTFGIMVVDGGHCTDPGAYVGGIVAWCQTQGVRYVQARFQDFDAPNGKLAAVVTDRERIGCDMAVIAAGAWSAPMAQRAGDHVPLESERGYHVEIPGSGFGPDIPVMPQDGKMANTVTRRGLRASGQVELASIAAPPDWRRADILMGHLRNTYPKLTERLDCSQMTKWQGNRPSTPDGLPVIGAASGISGVFYAFGHGHVGLASAPKTADIVADMIENKPLGSEIDAFSATRFR